MFILCQILFVKLDTFIGVLTFDVVVENRVRSDLKGKKGKNEFYWNTAEMQGLWEDSLPC